MPRNLLDLAVEMDAKSKRVGKAASEAAVQVGLMALRSLLDRTPVDTSTALSNWQVSLDAPKYNFINAYVPGYLGYTAEQSADQAFRVGTAELAKKKPGQTIFLTNSAPYIRNLNSGSSKQAPAGFVEATMLIARKRMPKVKL